MSDDPLADADADADADGGSDEAAPSADQPFPWDEPEPPSPDDAGTLSAQASAQERPRERHDAFTEAKKCAFLKALVKMGCILDACRLVGPSPRTIYRHQESDPRFLRHCQIALKMSGTPVELTAWERAVEGVEEEVAVGGQMVRRRRYSENLLRLLLQGSNPKKYGPRPGFKRKRLLRHERKQMDREIRAEIAAEQKLKERPFKDAVDSILRKIEAIERHEEPAKLAAGWTKSAGGHWIPPGYAPIPGWQAPGAEGGEGEPPRDSM
jgi:hypothetical protein